MTLRQTFPGTAHHDTQSIYLRWAPEWSYQSIFLTKDAIDYPADLQNARAMVQQVAEAVGASEIGRAMVVKLRAGGVIDPHIDEGVYADYYDRFHVALYSAPGNDFTVGDETIHMKPGECWQFNHRKVHTVRNGSSRERVHLIVDLRSD